MKADQPLLELIALKNAINEIEREITILEERRQRTRHIQIGAFTFRTGRDRFVDGGSAQCAPGGTRLAQLGAQLENVANGVSPDRFARRRREIGRQPPARWPRWFAFKTTSTAVPRRVIPVLAQKRFAFYRAIL